MFCPKCGRMNNDEDILCKGCGAALHDENEEKPAKKRAGTARVIIAALAALAVIAAAAAGILVSCDAPQQESSAVYHISL